MAEQKYILALDQGTTSSRALIFNRQGEILAVAQKEFTQLFPAAGQVEHDPMEIWSTQAAVAMEALSKLNLKSTNIAAIGITNQRETTIVWDRKTGHPIYNAIVWQDRRTAERCDELKANGKLPLIQQKTGLVLDAYFSATKVQWILDNVPGARSRAEKGELAFGTVDSWLVWKLTGGKVHVTDVSNASRTMLLNIHTAQWDKELLALFQIPEQMLPLVQDSSGIYGHTDDSLFPSPIPIAGMAGDQQAALFGQMCTEPGMVKNTYGTGCFLMMNTGEKPMSSQNNLLTTIGWRINGQMTYALEGSVFIGGAVVQWLRDGLGLIARSDRVEVLAGKVQDNGGVYLVPAFAGLGAPYWDQYARGAIFGITRGTTDAHIARAALESIAFQTYDVLEAMSADCGIKIKELRVDGGASINDELMMFQSAIIAARVIRPKILETTAMGAGFLAGLAVKYWESIEEIKRLWQQGAVFDGKMCEKRHSQMLKEWHQAVERVKGWANK
jgi:glycerol kinase